MTTSYNLGDQRLISSFILAYKNFTQVVYTVLMLMVQPVINSIIGFALNFLI